MLTKYRVEWLAPLGMRHIIFTMKRETATALYMLLNDNPRYNPKVQIYARKGRGQWREVEPV